MAATCRSARECLDALDKEAWGIASEAKPKFVSRSNPAAQWTGTLKGHAFFAYRASKLDCDVCSLKPCCCPNTPTRKIPRSIHEGAPDMARDIAATDAYVTSCRERKKIEMLLAHLKRIL